MRDHPIKKARKKLRKYKSMSRKLRNRVNKKVTNPKVVKSKASTLVKSLVKVFRPSEIGQGDGVMPGGRETENQAPPILLAGLISTASKKRRVRGPWLTPDWK